MKAFFKSKLLIFKRPSGTSRGVLKTKKTWFLLIENNGIIGIGECSPLSGLSIDDRPDYESKLKEVIEDPLKYLNQPLLLKNWPSILFGLEMAFLDLENGGNRQIFPSSFSKGEAGIPINGLIWMGDKSYMNEQIKNLLSRGFHCLKMKIGAINFQDEIEILKQIRQEYKNEDLILRVDANGAFKPEEALEKINRLNKFNLHSIEQPIFAGQIQEMAQLCRKTSIPIALDEELIPIQVYQDKVNLLETIKPQYIILKPSLVGGFKSSEDWITIADKLGIGSWATSALESNVGLNAISQWSFIKHFDGHQGLGTGSLYTNNIESPLEIRGEEIFYNSHEKWNLDELL